MYRNLLQFNGTYERERPIKNLYLSHQGLISEGLWVRIGQPRIFSEVMVVRGCIPFFKVGGNDGIDQQKSTIDSLFLMTLSKDP